MHATALHSVTTSSGHARLEIRKPSLRPRYLGLSVGLPGLWYGGVYLLAGLMPTAMTFTLLLAPLALLPELWGWARAALVGEVWTLDRDDNSIQRNGLRLARLDEVAHVRGGHLWNIGEFRSGRTCLLSLVLVDGRVLDLDQSNTQDLLATAEQVARQLGVRVVGGAKVVA